MTKGKAFWAAPELQADGAGREMDALSISWDSVTEKGKKNSRAEGAGCETGAGSTQAVEQGWAQLCQLQSGPWERQTALGGAQHFSGAGN